VYRERSFRIPIFGSHWRSRIIELIGSSTAKRVQPLRRRRFIGHQYNDSDPVAGLYRQLINFKKAVLFYNQLNFLHAHNHLGKETFTLPQPLNRPIMFPAIDDTRNFDLLPAVNLE
jgi:hypothetical protein